MILGETVPADDTDGGAFDVERVVDILMHQPTMAPFIAKILILKLATETPSPGYVERVATVFADTTATCAPVVRAVLTDPELNSPAVIRSQYKTPIEHFVGALRGLDARGGGRTLSLLDHARRPPRLLPAVGLQLLPARPEGSAGQRRLRRDARRRRRHHRQRLRRQTSTTYRGTHPAWSAAIT